MKLFDYYDESNSKDYIWYSSENLLYSEAAENNDGTVNLKIVFKQGQTYIYYKVDMMDYLQVKRAESNGRAFNIFITKKVDGQPKYQYKRIADSDLDEISKSMESLKDRAFKEKEEELAPKEEKQPDVDNNEKPSAKNIEDKKHKVDMKFDEPSGRLLFYVDGEQVAYYPCMNKNNYTRLALFLAPIMSYLGYPLKIDVGD